MAYQSWGRYPQTQSEVKRLYWRTEPLSFDDPRFVLPYGQGRSYGDSCLNHQGILFDTAPLNHFIQFDPTSGLLRCETGVTLAEILRYSVPQGWFLPVTPGTKFVSVGGAIANDVHGKNQHKAGTFGNHVVQFELSRSNGDRFLCSPTENKEWFHATLGGLGLTGLMLWAEIQLRPIANPLMDIEILKFKNLDEFFELSMNSQQDYEYTVAWLDCLSQGKSLGRGLFMRGNHASLPLNSAPMPRLRQVTVPLDMPGFLLNPFTMKAFNFLYFHKQWSRSIKKKIYYDPFFYPLDRIHHWNRIYGSRGFMQYQCVIPNEVKTMQSILSQIALSGMGSFLSVLKVFSAVPSQGLLSFARPGMTFALDFPHRGPKTFLLLEQLDQIVREHQGAVYPAKDARMSAESFKSYYPRWAEFTAFVDPKFSSSFWRRVMK